MQISFLLRASYWALKQNRYFSLAVNGADELFNIAQQHLKKRDIAAAKKILEELIDKFPRDERAYLALFRLYHHNTYAGLAAQVEFKKLTRLYQENFPNKGEGSFGSQPRPSQSHI